MDTGLLDFFQLGIGIYLIYGVITRNEKITCTEQLKECADLEKVKRNIRAIITALGVIVTLDGVSGLIKSYGFSSETRLATAAWVPSFLTWQFLFNFSTAMIVLSLILIGLLIFYLSKHAKRA